MSGLQATWKTVPFTVTELQSSALENSFSGAYSQDEAEMETEGGSSQRQALAQPRQPNWPHSVLHLGKKTRTSLDWGLSESSEPCEY